MNLTQYLFLRAKSFFSTIFDHDFVLPKSIKQPRRITFEEERSCVALPGHQLYDIRRSEVIGSTELAELIQGLDPRIECILGVEDIFRMLIRFPDEVEFRVEILVTSGPSTVKTLLYSNAAEKSI